MRIQILILGFKGLKGQCTGYIMHYCVVYGRFTYCGRGDIYVLSWSNFIVTLFSPGTNKSVFNSNMIITMVDNGEERYKFIVNAKRIYIVLHFIYRLASLVLLVFLSPLNIFRTRHMVQSFFSIW